MVVMTKRSYGFMKRWIAENIGRGPGAEIVEDQLNAAPLRLRDDAAKVGIASMEMVDDPEDTKDAILEAMKR